MENIHLLSLARAKGYYDSLRVDSAGNLAETCSANLFFLKDGRLHTPSLNTGILPGVTRSALMSIPDLTVEEGVYVPGILFGADAVFITNSTSGLQPIDRIEGLPGAGTVSYGVSSNFIRELAVAFEQIQTTRSIALPA